MVKKWKYARFLIVNSRLTLVLSSFFHGLTAIRCRWIDWLAMILLAFWHGMKLTTRGREIIHMMLLQNRRVDLRKRERASWDIAYTVGIDDDDWILECRIGSSVTGQNRCLAFTIPDELESAWSSPIWQRMCASVNNKLQGVNSMLRATRSRNPFTRGKSFDSWTKLSSPSTATSCYRKGFTLNRPWLGSYSLSLAVYLG